MSTLNVRIIRHPEVEPAGGPGTIPRFDWMGVDRQVNRPYDGDDSGAGAPGVPKYGMNVDELYDYQRKFTEEAADRLLGVGAHQYDRGSKQKFEDMDPRDLINELRAELLDVVNYAMMIDIQVARWQEALRHGR